MFRKPVSVFLVCLFLAHFAGFYVYFVVQLREVRIEMRAQLKTTPEDQLEIIKLSVEDFKKTLVEEHEIKVNNKMYDIARIKNEGDTVLVYCIHDEAEDSLLALLDKILKLPLKSKENSLLVLKFTALIYILPVSESIGEAFYTTNKNVTPYIEQYTNTHQQPAAPPPKA